MPTQDDADRLAPDPPATAGVVPRDRLEKTIAALEREKEIVDVLYRVAQAVARESDLAEIVQVVTDETTALTGAQFGAFFYNVVGRDGEAYALYTLAGAPREAFERFPMPRATAIFRPTFEGTANVRLDDVTADPRFGRNPPYNGMPPGHLPVRSYLAVPVVTSDGEVAGGLFFGHEDVGVFTADHERIATGVATHAGTAIEKARLLAAERAARAEAEERANATLALEHVDDGVFMLDRDGVVRYWNAAASRIFGVDREAVAGRPIGEAVPGWEGVALAVPIATSADPSHPRTLPFDSGGGERWLSIYGVGFERGTVYACRDITEEHRLDRLRSDLTATVSHELRTPLAAVYGAAQTLRREGLTGPTATELLDVLTAQAERLAGLIEDLLRAGQLEAGTISLREEAVDAVEVAHRVARGARAAGTKAAIVVDAPPSLPRIRADDHRLGEVLANLIENASKYAAVGADDRIVVRLRERPRTVRLEVVDEGPGIPPREHERVFEKFYRLDPQLKDGVPGTGLGLYICRELVERMHGHIGVESADGTGTTVWFELPQAASFEPAG